MFALSLRSPLLLSRATPRALTTSSTLLRLLPRPVKPSTLLQHHARHYARPRSLRNQKPKPATPPPPPAELPNPAPTGVAAQPRLIDRVWAAGQISDLATPPAMTAGQRLLRPTLFTLLIVGGSIIYAYTWTPPKLHERWFPTVPQSFSTLAGIIAINTAVFIAWKIPLPLTWRILNRHFISCPALPHSFSMLGSAFSHQTFTHLFMNMAILYLFGSTLCEQIGTGPFLGLYMSGAVMSSLGSLVYNVARQRFGVVSLGASGAVMAVSGAYSYFNPERELYLFMLPFLVLKAKTFVWLLALFETVGIVRNWAVVDHVAHLSGLGWGLGGGYMIMTEYKRRMNAMAEQGVMRILRPRRGGADKSR